jgi:hypothetical protein
MPPFYHLSKLHVERQWRELVVLLLLTKANFSLDGTVNYQPNSRWKLSDLHFTWNPNHNFPNYESSYEDELIAGMQY